MSTHNMIRQDGETLDQWKGRKCSKTPKNRLIKVQNDSRVILESARDILTYDKNNGL